MSEIIKASFKEIPQDNTLDRIRQLRKQRGMTQKDVGDALEMDTSTITRIEKGERTLTHEFLSGFAEVMGITYSELVSGEDVPDPLVEELREEIAIRDEKIIEQANLINDLRKEIDLLNELILLRNRKKGPEG